MREDFKGYWTCRIYSDAVALNDLWVRPGSRGAGIGAHLLDEVVLHATKLELPVALYCASAGTNPYAPRTHQGMTYDQLRAWYERRGFIQHPDWQHPELLLRPPGGIT